MLKVSTFNLQQLQVEPSSKIKVYTVIDDVNTIKNKNSTFNPAMSNQLTSTISVLPVLYALNEAPDTSMATIRFNAINALFKMWTNAGYNTRRAKSPFSSKAFNKFIDEIDYLKADYIILDS